MLTKNLLNFGCVGLAALTTWAAPLDKLKVATTAKWLVHLDIDALRSSALGNYLITDLLNPALEDMDELKNLNLSMNISNISSVTAYGPAFEKNADGVLLVSTSANVKKDLDTVAGMFLLSAGTNSPFVLIENKPLPLYSFYKSVYFAPIGDTLIVAKSKDQIERAHDVLRGKAESLAKMSSFQEFPATQNGFFFLAMAEGFNGNAAMPPQAQILKETQGGRLAVGERGKNLFVNLVFQGKDDLATTKIQQVLQGLVALVSLSQNDADITQLAGATKIAADGKNVMVSVEYPVTKAIEKIKEEREEKPRPHKKKNKKERKHKVEPAPEQDSPPQDENAPK
ncbi:MAG TPA: hypothetical protein VK633_02345 [Verrucomicrobiae bacterium]|nr:hypothetical protein [Verrucomicrobiae bacterium]